MTLNRQEVYDALVDAARSGVMPSVKDKSCVYDDGNGHHCAVGVLLNRIDALTSRARNAVSVITDSLLASECRALTEATGLSARELADIQTYHDIAAFEQPDTFASAFIEWINEMPCFADVVRVEP